METKEEELIKAGFILISTNKANTGLSVYAKFSEYKDTVQYVYFKEGVYHSDIETISFGKLLMFEKMVKILTCRQFFQKDIEIEDRWG